MNTKDIGMAAWIVAAYPREDIIDRVQSAIFKYQTTPSDDMFRELAIECSLILLKYEVGDDPSKAMDVIKEMEKVNNISHLINPGGL